MMSDAKDVIETGLGSIGKVKIIRALANESKLCTIYVLHNKTHLKREDIKKNLDDLIEIGWVRQAKYANVVYGISRENKYVERLLVFFKEVGYTDQP